ncbi:S9 family peptidase [Rubripirellula reticaptiva]|uniref:S9 family peptidase n=1 Tax=Rubripirellula reticaptiva TaxID=2528013 RepID=UPI001644076D|nr:S9 family peptidase [Rubripirellula reticaptiva]
MSDWASVAVVALVMEFVVSPVAMSAVLAEEKLADENPSPQISLRTLFHPDDKQDFDGQLPATHWMDAVGGPSTLLIKRDKAWTQVEIPDASNPDADHSPTEKPWPIVDRLASQIQKLDGISPEQAAAIASRSIPKMTRATDAVLVKIGKALAIASPDQPARWLTRDGATWKNATIDSTARRVAYTVDGDLFVVDTTSGLTMRLTDDADDTLLDGILDWTYQEEIFGRGNYRGFWFSPDGDWLAMLRIDISRIEPYTLPDSTSDRGAGLVRRYSKAGDAIPQAKLFVWDLRQSAAGRVPAARLIESSDSDDERPSAQRLITGVWWHPNRSRMLYSVSDRLQTWREVRSIDTDFLEGRKNDSDLLLREQSPAWVEPPAAPGWMHDGSFLWQSEVPSGRSRLYQVSLDGSIVRPVTPDSFDVTAFKVSRDEKHVLICGDRLRGTVEQQVYRIPLAGIAEAGPSSTAPVAMTPHAVTPGSTATGAIVSDAFARSVVSNVVVPAGAMTLDGMVQVTRGSGWHDVDISPDGQQFTDRFSTPDRPARLGVRSADGSVDEALADSTPRWATPIVGPELFTIVTDDGVPLPAMLVKPNLPGGVGAAGQPSDSGRFPVIIEVYGGPRSPVVSAKWGGTKTLYRELLARRGIATLVVDNRSSAGRGIAESWSIRGQFGEVEMKDLGTVVTWLGGQSWADTDRLAIRGWSFGGFLTLYAMTHSDSFAAGIAGGSVTDWREYDSIYTERYMGLPASNEAGYTAASPLAKAADLSGSLLMIHGEVDDNVHPANSMRMAKALQKAGKDFRLMIYPGAAHSVSSPSQVWHMSVMTDRFLLESLLDSGK